MTLGEPAEVDIEATIRPKSAALARLKGQKVGARNSAADGERIQSVHDLVVELGAECADTSTAAADNPEDPDGDNGKDLKPDRVRLLAEVQALELGITG